LVSQPQQPLSVPAERPVGLVQSDVPRQPGLKRMTTFPARIKFGRRWAALIVVAAVLGISLVSAAGMAVYRLQHGGFKFGSSLTSGNQKVYANADLPLGACLFLSSCRAARLVVC